MLVNTALRKAMLFYPSWQLIWGVPYIRRITSVFTTFEEYTALDWSQWKAFEKSVGGHKNV